MPFRGKPVESATIIVLVLLLLLPPAYAQTPVPLRPIAVSPGSPTTASRIADITPTFLWGAVEGARNYQIVVFRLPDDSVGGDLVPVLELELPGSVLGYTPSLDQALARGLSYGWMLRAHTAEGATEWSEASIFRISALPSALEVQQALDVLRVYAARVGVESAVETTGTQPGAQLKAEPSRTTHLQSRSEGIGETLLVAPDRSAMRGELSDETGVVFGLHGISNSGEAGSSGVAGQSAATSGDVFGVQGQAASPAGAAGVFDNIAGGDILRGLVNATEVFTVEGTGNVSAISFSGDGSNLTGIIAESATQLVADGTDCLAGEAALGVDEAGNTQGCYDVATQSELDDAVIVNDGAYVNVSGDTMTGDLDLGGNTLQQAGDVLLHTTGTDNTGVGERALTSITSGRYNTAVGSGALSTSATVQNNTAMGHKALHYSGGSNNTAVGTMALYTTTVADGSSAFGYAALKYNTSILNTALGSEALKRNTSGSHNTAAGALSLVRNTTGHSNTAVGQYAMGDNTTGQYNTAVGRKSLRNSIDSDSNTAIGAQALEDNTTGEKNSALGRKALENNTTGGFNTAGGVYALRNNKGGAGNTAVGSYAMNDNDSGNFNVALGSSTLRSSTTGFYNTALGSLAMLDNETGTGNTAVGDLALGANVGGSNNTTLGRSSGLNATGSENIFLGYGAGSLVAGGSFNIHLGTGGGVADSGTIRIGDAANHTATYVAGIYGTPIAGNLVAVDANGRLGTTGGGGSLLDADLLDGLDSLDFVLAAGDSMTGDLDMSANDINGLGSVRKGGELFIHTMGSGNTALGEGALTSNTTGSRNTAHGDQALTSNTTGEDNTSVGVLALRYNVAGSSNTAVGSRALFNNQGGDNTALGVLALFSNTSGYSNTATGSGALGGNTSGYLNSAVGKGALVANTDGGQNTAIGASAMAGNTTGDSNTALGVSALQSNTSGVNSTALGSAALSNATTGHGNLAIGFFAGTAVTTGGDNIHIGNYGVSGDADTIRIGSSSRQDRAFVAGIRGVTTDNADAIPVVIDSDGQLGTVSSSRRYKEQIRGMGTASEALLELRPVTFRYRRPFADGEQPLQYGLIAEEVAEVAPQLVVYNDRGQPETVRYHLLSTLLLNELQKLRERVEGQERELARLRVTASSVPER